MTAQPARRWQREREPATRDQAARDLVRDRDALHAARERATLGNRAHERHADRRLATRSVGTHG